jgi:hypothetical protein
MLDYSKMILDKVSFDATLFENELKKALANLQDEKSKEDLKKWCYETYAAKYEQVLNKHFQLATRNR